jgi:hypothetical protein
VLIGHPDYGLSRRDADGSHSAKKSDRLGPSGCKVLLKDMQWEFAGTACCIAEATASHVGAYTSLTCLNSAQGTVSVTLNTSHELLIVSDSLLVPEVRNVR